jgi:hypothetical protein
VSRANTNLLLCCADVGMRQPTAQATWLIPAGNKRGDARARLKLQAIEQLAQLPAQACLLEELNLAVRAAVNAPSVPDQLPAPAQDDVAELPMAEPVAAEPQQLRQQTPSALLVGSRELPGADDSTGARQEEEAPPAQLQEEFEEVLGPPAACDDFQEASEAQGASEPPSSTAAAAGCGLSPVYVPPEEAQAAMEAPSPPPGPEAPAARDPYEFDPEADAASDGQMYLWRSAAKRAARDKPGPAAEPRRDASAFAGAAALAQFRASPSQSYSGAMDAGQALTQVANIINVLPSEASPSAAGAGPSSKAGAGRQGARAKQPRRSPPAAAREPASGFLTRSGRGRPEPGVGNELQQAKRKRQKSDAAAAPAEAVCAVDRPQTRGCSKTFAESACQGSVREHRKSQTGQAARGAAACGLQELPSCVTRNSSKQQAALVASPQAETQECQKQKARPPRTIPTPLCQSQQRQVEDSPRPAARPAKEPETVSAVCPERAKRTRRLSVKIFNEDYEPGCLPGRTTTVKAQCPEQDVQDKLQPASGPDDGAGKQHHSDACEEAAAQQMEVDVFASESEGPALFGDAAEDWGAVLMTPHAEDSAAQGHQNADAASQQQLEAPFDAHPSAQEQPALASQAGSQAKMDPNIALRRSGRSEGIPPEFSPKDLTTPRPRRMPPTPGTAAARASGCAQAPARGPCSAAAAETQTPAPFKDEQMKKAAKSVIKRKREKLAPASAAACSPGGAAGQSSSWATQADQRSDCKQATGETLSEVLVSKEQRQQQHIPGAMAEEPSQNARPYATRQNRIPTWRRRDSL